MDIIGKQNEVIDMAKYTVIIEEVVSEEFEIHANTEEEAQKIAADAYNNAEIVLAPGNLISKKMTVVSHHGEFTEWREF